MPRPAKAPAVGFTWKARAVPIPWLATPVANPRARQSRMRSAFSTGVATTAPVMPVRITSTAVSVGDPPMLSEMPIATGAVADLGASEASSAGRTPSRAAMATAEPAAVADPAMSAATTGSAARLSRARLS